MVKLYASLILSFIALLIINITFVIVNLFFLIYDGIDWIFHGKNFVETIYYSIYLKWILLADGLWILILFLFLIKRKHYKTDAMLHYINYQPIIEPKICVVIPTYNEEINVEKVIEDYKDQKNTKYVIVVDNHSTDRTVEIAKNLGVQVIEKNRNKGFPDSCVVGLKESLKTDANVIVLTECDGTFSGYDVAKMVPYLDNCDMVVGTRQVQVLTEKGNQNSMFYVWGNYLLAKLIQIKYFSLLHLGIVQLTDIGCVYRCIRRNALEKVIDKFTNQDTGEVVIDSKSGVFAALMTMTAIENDLRIVEVPITFKKRIGISKTGAENKIKAIKYGLQYFWYILNN